MVIEDIFFLVILLVTIYLFWLSIKQRSRLPWTFLIILIGVFFYDLRQLNLIFIHIRLFLPLWMTVLFFYIVEFRACDKFFVTKCNFLRSTFIGIITSLLIFPLVIFWPSASTKSPYQLDLGNINWLVLIYAIDAGLSEELLFRGAILGYLKRYRLTLLKGVVFQSVVFSLSHVYYIQQFYWGSILFTFFIGIIAGMITWKTKNISGAIVLHILVNLTRFLIF